MATNVIKRTPAAGGPSYNPGDAFHVPDQGQYGPRNRDFHVGIDYAAPAGTQIPAASSGEVVYSGPSGGFHYAVMVKSTGPNGVYYSVYGHVDPEGALPAGTKVSIGQPIGAVGTVHEKDGERSTGSHFHFQIATEEKLKGIRVPGDGGLGFTTRQTALFTNPNEFKGWASADNTPYNALTYVPIRDGVTFQPVPHLAQTPQAGQHFSGANSFNPPGLSPSEIDRFYTETGNPSTGPSGPLGNNGAAARRDGTVGISPTERDRLYNFTQLGGSATAPSTANGITPLNQSTSAPWYSSPAVTGNYKPTDNFNWNKVPAGNRGSLPAGDPGDASSPVMPAPEKQKRSAAPDGAAWDSAQAPARTAFQQDAAYSPTGGVFGDFPRASSFAATPLTSAFNGSGPRMAGDFHAPGQGVARLLAGASRFIGNGLASPAEAASPSEPLVRGPAALKAQSANPIADPSAGVYFPDSNSALAAETNGTAPSIANKDFRYLARTVADKPQASVFATGAPAVPFVASDNPNSWGGLPGLLAAASARVEPQNPSPSVPPQQATRPAGLVSGEPMPDYPFRLPIWGLPDSRKSSEDSDDWLMSLFRSVGDY